MRKIFFWAHLVVGSLAAIVVLIMGVTGVLLTYERQMIEWADRSVRSVPPSTGAPRLPAEVLIDRIRENADALPSNIVLQSDPTAPVQAVIGRDRTLLIDVYTGASLGEASPGIRSFFHVVTDWHRWLAMEGASRPTGRAITGAANLGFLFLVLSGIYIWIPRKWGWPQVRSVLLFRGGLAGKARDFNWHNVIGIWCCIPLFFIVLGAVVISYPWATSLLYRAMGDEPPAASGRPPVAGAKGERGGGGSPRRPLNVAGMDAALRAVEAQTPDWQTISFRVPDGDRATFSVARSHRGRPDKRSTVTVSRASGQIVEQEVFDSFNRGRKARSWLRFLHTGEALGFGGQTIAGIASAGSAVLAWTGVALSWRRFTAWRRRKKQTPVAEVALSR